MDPLDGAVIALWLAACAPSVDVDWDRGGRVAPTGAVVTTTDFAVGALATVSLDTLAVRDAIAPTSADPLVVADAGFVLQLNAYQADFVRVYIPGEFTAPRAEFALRSGDNPHDAAMWGDTVFLTLYERSWLDVRTPSGAPVDRVDLAPWADGDGLPEASSLEWVDGTLLVALERLDRRAGWAPAGGRVLAVDPGTRAVTDAFDVGPSPRLFAHPSEPGTAVVVSGSFVRTAHWYVPALDGGIDVLDPSTGATRSLVRDADLGALVSGFAEGPDGIAAVLLDPGDRSWSVGCLDVATGALTVAYRTDAWLADVAVDPQGRAWVAERSWEGRSGVRLVDLEACAALPDGFVPTLLPPYRLAFY